MGATTEKKTRDVYAQAKCALLHAQELRLSKAGLKKRVQRGEMTLMEVLLELDPPEVQKATLLDLATWVPNVGPNRLAKLNLLAIKDGLNLLLPVSRVSPARRQVFVELVEKVSTWGY